MILGDFCSTDDYVNKIFTTADKYESLEWSIALSWFIRKIWNYNYGVESSGKMLTAGINGKILQDLNNPTGESLCESKYHKKNTNYNYKKKVELSCL